MAKNDKIRENIIDIAQQVFSNLGFDKTTMELIAQKAQKGKSTLYYYFKSKEELYAAVIDKEGNFIMKEILKVINSSDSIEIIFRNYIHKRFDLTKKVVNYYSIVKDDYLKFYPMIQKYRHKHDEFEIMAIKQILLKGLLNKQIRLKEDELDNTNREFEQHYRK